MHLLELPMEILDEIATYFTYFDFLILRQTSKKFYHAICNDDILRQALLDVETYWASESHIRSICIWRTKDPKKVPLGPYPSYGDFLYRAPCFTCLRISQPKNTLLVYYPGINENVPMLPWHGQSFSAVRYNTTNPTRKCIDCTIQAADEKGIDQEWHRSTLFDLYTLQCRSCRQKTVGIQSPRLRIRNLGICPACFDRSHPGWTAFRARLDVRVRRIQRYHSWLEGQVAEHRAEARIMAQLTPGIGAGEGEGDLRPRVTRFGQCPPDKLPPRDDVEEDWALWSHIFASEDEKSKQRADGHVGCVRVEPQTPEGVEEEEGKKQEEKIQPLEGEIEKTKGKSEPKSKNEWEELCLKMSLVVAQMQGYLYWMRYTDDGYRPCKHPARPPETDKLVDLGEWPMWEKTGEEIEAVRKKGCQCVWCVPSRNQW